MSTIDMTQAAGLQAVDAEGNVIGTLSVDDLTELVANNLVKSTQNQIAAARSVSTMSEASTLAASDDYENTLPIDANPASVRTLDDAGNPKQTGISAFAQVVGELLPQRTSFITEILNKITTNYEDDLNSIDIPPNKLYLFRLSSSCTNGPDAGTNGSFLIHANFDSVTYCQILIRLIEPSSGIYFRNKPLSQSWGEWRLVAMS